MRAFRRCTRIFVLSLLGLSVFVPVILLSHGLKHTNYEVSEEFVEDLSITKRRGKAQTLNVIEQENGEGLKEPLLVVYNGNTSNSDVRFSSDGDRRSVEYRVSANATRYNTKEGTQRRQQEDLLGTKEVSHVDSVPHNPDMFHMPMTLDEKLEKMKDQVIWAEAYLSFSPANSSSHSVRELKNRIKDVQQAMSQSTRYSRVSRRDLHKMKAMESTLLKASRIYPDCSAVVKHFLAMHHNVEERVRAHQTRETFLQELWGRTVPRHLHCLSMRLTAKYYALEPEEREFPNKHKRQDPDLYHFVVFSDNILSCSVVVNSTVSTAREPARIVFHVVTDSANFPSMSMWFLSNPPGKATVHVERADSFRFLSGKHGVTTKEASVGPRYTSELNHLLFYLPDIFPHLNKIILLDHDVVVRKDLTELWSKKMRGRVNGAVLTCDQEEPSFRRMDMFINFTDTVIAYSRFDATVCTWAFGMNLFDLQQWRQRNLTRVYHKYLQLGNDRPLWKAGTLALGWITFYGHTIDLDKKWHLLGLGYDSGVRQEDIEKAAVIHYDGNLKPWLPFGIEKYKLFWSKHVNYEHPFLQSCDVHEYLTRSRIRSSKHELHL